MDVSDGLVADLGKICAASGVGADIRLDGYPGFAWGDLGRFLGDEAISVALTGGEDYELLACGPRELLLEQNLLIVGEINRGKGVRVLDENGRTLRFPSRGYDAFASR
jgi:thiamine-monophosphate kinase